MEYNLGYITYYKKFRDLTNDHVYNEGDKFPFDDSEVGTDRLNELLSKKNKIGKKLIRPKFLEDCDIDELKELASKFQIEVAEETEEILIDALKKAREEAKSFKKILTSKNIPFEDNATLPELKTLVEKANGQ